MNKELREEVRAAGQFHSFASNPFKQEGNTFQVSPEFFIIMPQLCTAAREIIRFISFNMRDGKVYLSPESLLVHSAFKHSAAIKAAVAQLLAMAVIAKTQDKHTYWVNFIYKNNW